MGLLIFDQKEKEAGLEMARLLLLRAELFKTDPEAAFALNDNIAEIEKKLSKTHCSCTTRHGLLKQMRKKIGHKQYGLAFVAAKEFLKTIDDDIKNMMVQDGSA